MIMTEFELETKESRQPDSQTSDQAGSRIVWKLGSLAVGKPDSWHGSLTDGTDSRIVWQKGQPDSLTDETAR